MASNCKQTEQIKSTEDVNFKMRRSFSWDRAFFTNEGFLDAEELSNMIDGDGNDVDYQLEKNEEIESLEAKLFEEIEASNQKSKMSTGKTDSQPKKSTVGPRKAAPTKPAPLSGGFGGKNVKSSTTIARKNTKTVKSAIDSPSKTPPGICTKNKMSLVNTRLPKTSPSSPVSPGSSGSSSSSTSAVNQRSKIASSVPRRSVINNEKSSSSTINSRKKDDSKTGKPTNVLILNTPPVISLKNKPPPVISHPLSPLGLSNSSSSSTTQQPSDQKSISRGGLTKTGSPNGATKTRKIQPPKTVAGSNTGFKTNSQKTTNTMPKTSKKQSSGKAKPLTKNVFVMAPEIMDLKGKLNALKMEISMQKDRFKESGKVESS